MRPKKKTVVTVDLFCGAGGESTGMGIAVKRCGLKQIGIAINHWERAVQTMMMNHPDITTYEMDIMTAIPAELVPGGVVDLLHASPSCTHHSRAKGGRPCSNQLRSQPDVVLRWLDDVYVKRMTIENVPEIMEWGPLNAEGSPIKHLKGQCFSAWVKSIEARNYKVEYRIVNCAEYGDATSRRRFFLKAVRKGCGRIRWPEPTHAEHPHRRRDGRMLKPWRGVRECLDLNDLGTSIFNRERPLSQNTLRRIAVGMSKYNGMDFLMDMLGSDGGDGSRVHPLTKPMPTQHSGGNRCAVVRPFVVKLRGGQDVDSIDSPISAIMTSGGHHMICQPLVLDHFKNGKAQSVDEPIGAQTTHDRYSVVQPFIMNNNENNVPRPLDKPLVTLTTGNHAYLCTPLILGQHGGAACRPINKPCPTIANAGAVRIATPIILDMSRPGGSDSGHIRPADRPIQSLTTCDNVQVATPVIFDKAVGLPRLPGGRYIDILLRMLKPSELAAAHSFPKGYVIVGNRAEQVKQIGNSVPVMTAAAMCEADLRAA